MVIMDFRGKMVKEIVNGPLIKDPHNYEWDGTTDRNKTARPGIYIVKISMEDAQKSNLVIRKD